MIKDYKEYSLLSHNTFGIDVQAARYIDFSTEDELSALLQSGTAGESPLVIGGGSNLLFVGDYHGTVLHSSISDISIIAENDEDVFLRVGSGVNWDLLVEYTVNNGWYGLENLSLIPGEVGASAVQNVGAYGVEAGDLITEIEALAIKDGAKTVFLNGDCNYGYRTSIFKREEKGKYVITYVTFNLKKSAGFRLGYGNLKERVESLGGATLANVRKAVCEIRSEKLPDPLVTGSAGSFFMNPVVPDEKAAELAEKYPAMPQYKVADGVKLSAGWLIEQCGWKDTPHERVGVYKHQALVVINRGGATGADVLAFATAVCRSVEERFGVELKMEVNVIE
ncbi:MAG: UDP-N-acetylmuramate dehydrogenase [Bacteroidaceae bacterium]|nr:UDP-N-acetylmuramate dehydrogenase [Bacteroidaceae bacterium]